MDFNNEQIIYLSIAFVIWMIGYAHTGRFVRPKWKIPGKFIFYMVASYAFINWIGPYSLIFIIGHPLSGLAFHIHACKKNEIDWKTCRPRDKYLSLQEQWSKGNF